jgi:cytochrome c553
VFGAAFAVLAGCSANPEETPGGSAGTAHGGASSGGAAHGGASSGGASSGGAASGDATKGATVYSINCTSCHGADAAGNQGPNITMSMTAGIGSWTYAQFENAVRLGKAKDGTTQLCSLMTMFAEKDISEPSMLDLWAYLKSKPISDVPQKGSFCGSLHP